MRPSSHPIERNVKLIAVVGAVICLTLGGALVVVQDSLGASQAEFADVVVPTQAALGELSGAVGSLFLRESEILGAPVTGLEVLADRSELVAAVLRAEAELGRLAVQPARAHLGGFHEVVVELSASAEAFVAADDALFPAVSHHRALRERVDESIEAFDADLRRVVGAAWGVEGVLRLEYMSTLRRAARALERRPIDAELMRPAILGDSRAQLVAIEELMTALLRLGVLSGRVGHAASADELNALAANELAQNREEISGALVLVERLLADSGLSGRVRALRVAAEALVARVGDERSPESLAVLRREMLAATTRANAIQHAAAEAARRVNDVSSHLRTAAAQAAHAAREGAEATIATSRVITVVVVLFGLLLAFIGAFPVRASVIALRAQNNTLKALSDELAQANEGLEDVVRERTAALQLVLDSTGDGLLTVGLTGELLPERSRAVVEWFGEPRARATLWEYLAPDDPQARDALWLGYEQLVSDIFPFEVAADQAPASLTRAGHSYTLGYREVSRAGALERVLVLVRDVSAQIEAVNAEREVRELHLLIGNILRDREGFRRSIEECSALIGRVRGAPRPVDARRALHTLKGNSAIMGFTRIAERIHELETLMADEDRGPSAAEVDALEALWHESLVGIEDYLGASERRVLEIGEDEVCALLDVAEECGAMQLIGPIVGRWRDEPAVVPLDRLATQARYLARRLDKEVEVTVVAGPVRVAPEPLKDFWAALVHVVRNALDHGIEAAEERARAGKTPVAQLELTARRDGDWLEVAIADDGRGIPWESVRGTAAARGLPCATASELVDALFADGFSTTRVVTDLSGRGVGLGAVRSECEALGGEVGVASSAGLGTRFTFRLPWAAVTQVTPACAA